MNSPAVKYLLFAILLVLAGGFIHLGVMDSFGGAVVLAGLLVGIGALLLPDRPREQPAEPGEGSAGRACGRSGSSRAPIPTRSPASTRAPPKLPITPRWKNPPASVSRIAKSI